jgi:NTP pyrophosphatase (non-canonical NTP hydrolase)
VSDDSWITVDRLVEWLDEEVDATPGEARLLRLMKLQEEVGEVAQAVIGATTANPRKGASHTWEDVQQEVCDVILTGMVALATLTPDGRKVFQERLALVAERSLAGRG